MKTSGQGVALMHHYEQCRLRAYKTFSTEPWTCGWGSTGKDSEGNVIDENTVWTQEKADHEFVDRLAREFEPGVEDRTNGATQAQFDALVCLAYNIGLGNFRTSTVLRKHNSGDFEGAANAFPMWNKAGGRVMKGLQRRRAAERFVYLGQDAESAIKKAEGMFP